MSQAIAGNGNSKNARGHGDMSGTLTTIILATALGLTLASVSQAMGSPDVMLYNAILAGSVGGALCSLAIKQPKSPRELISVVIPNAVFGLVFGPWAFDTACARLPVSPNFQSAVAVSGAMSGFVSMFVWIIVPKLLQWAVGADWPTIILERAGLQKKTDVSGK